MPEPWKLARGTLGPNVVQASSFYTMVCACGCGQLKMLLADANGTCFAALAGTPEEWLSKFIPHVTRDCIAMMGDKPQ